MPSGTIREQPIELLEVAPKLMELPASRSSPPSKIPTLAVPLSQGSPDAKWPTTLSAVEEPWDSGFGYLISRSLPKVLMTMPVQLADAQA